MDSGPELPLKGREQLELFNLLAQAVDPEGRIPAAMQALAPIEGRVLLDVGAGVGDRTIPYALEADRVEFEYKVAVYHRRMERAPCAILN